MKHVVDSPIAESEPTPRRTFLVRLAAGAIGGLVGLFPFIAGFGVFFDPLRRRNDGAAADGGEMVRIGPLDVLPADGIPRQFPLSIDVTDAWTRSPAQRVGTVFLCRTDTAEGPRVIALSSICPHLGCAVDFLAKDDHYTCPCHASAFAKDGQKIFGPSLRGLDPLEVRLIDVGDGTDIYVAYERFRTGIAERVPVG